jgi:membrane protease YdiL (CAAX protease family)
MPTAPFYVTPSRRRALMQGLTVLLVFFGFQFAGALVDGGAAAAAAQKLEHPLESVLLTGGLLLLPVVAFSMRDGGWCESLGLKGLPWPRLVGASAAAVIGGYGLNVVASLLFLLVRHLTGGAAELAASRAAWMAKLSDVPTSLIVPMVLFVGLWEELVFRGFLLGRLRGALSAGVAPGSERRRDFVAAAVLSLLFGLGHAYQGLLGVLQTTLLGFVLSLLVLWSGSLWPAVVAHATIDGFGLFALRVLKPFLAKAAEGKLGI